MTGLLATLSSSLPPGIAFGLLLAPCLIWLAHRAICFLELRMILRALPCDDRVTAAVAYVNAHRTQERLPTSMRQNGHAKS